MNTLSHAIIGLSLKKINRLKTARIPWQAVLWGSIMPDIPFGVISLGATFYYRVIIGNHSPNLMEEILHPLYFNNPFWISAYNLLHAPIILGLSVMVLWRWRFLSGSVQNWLFWFISSSAVHSFIDILTHHDDGPLILWPINWTVRFHSPISYWDPAYFGAQFLIFEILLDAILLGLLLKPKFKNILRLR